jgi:hypothetical protein
VTIQGFNQLLPRLVQGETFHLADVGRMKLNLCHFPYDGHLMSVNQLYLPITEFMINLMLDLPFVCVCVCVWLVTQM